MELMFDWIVCPCSVSVVFRSTLQLTPFPWVVSYDITPFKSGSLNVEYIQALLNFVAAQYNSL